MEEFVVLIVADGLVALWMRISMLTQNNESTPRLGSVEHGKPGTTRRATRAGCSVE